METKSAKIRETFEEQMKICNENIEKYQKELSKLQEYRIKLIGGFETLDLIEKEDSDNNEDLQNKEL